ncbi:MAG: DUF349 domain-containing protein [Chitinophagaceae bacterium]|nr:DUF349 domain-containing protein [Chitinophagaceae bacterium]
MSQELTFDLSSWWNGISFDGKELFTLADDGKLTIYAGKDGKERVLAEVTAENAETVLEPLKEKFASLQTKVNELNTEWNNTEDKLKLADKVHQLKNQILSASALGNIEALAAALAPAEQEIAKRYDENYAYRLKLAEEAETLAEASEWKETTNALRELIDKWKASGHTDKQRSDKLWTRIDAARNKFNERKQKYFEDQEKDLLGNLDLKLDLVEQAESLINSVEWKKTSETFHRLTNEWKTIGHTLSKKNEELWQRFIAAKSAFFDRKREHSDRIAQEQEQHFVVKSALVEKAEALKDSKEWNNTAIAYAALMEEWKKAGRVGGEKGDELWNRFLAAQDHFFTAKKRHTEEIRIMHEQNLARKTELLQRAERIKNSTNWNDTTAELNELLDEWKTIGPVAREHSNKIWEEFIAARKHFFARKDANREQRKQHFEQIKTVRSAQAREMVAKLLTDIKEEEDKLVDFKSALENITPGKKADELRKHLEQLLIDGEQKIRRLKEKYDAVKDEYGKQAEDAAKEVQAGATAGAPVAQATETTEATPDTEAQPEA